MTKKNKNLPAHPSKRIGIMLVGAVLAAVLIYFTYYFIHFFGYKGYQKFIQKNEYEAGTTFAPLEDVERNVKGMELVAENDCLKLYTDTKTASFAIYDKRNQTVTYSNPQNADADEIANETIKNFMKSQLIVQYYNSDIVSATIDSYSTSVARGAFSYEGITNGIRYLFSMDAGNSISFKVPLEYRLKDDGVEVTVPVDQIEESEGSIYRIQMLRFMGAPDVSDEGYFVVPNGSGSIIRFNNGKQDLPDYSQYVYGLDPLASTYTTVENTADAKLALFATCYDDRSILATIEEGSSVSIITCGVSGSMSEYNYAYATFVIRNADNLRMFGDNSQDVYIVEKEPYSLNCTVRYTMLTDEYKGYEGVANYYRNRLVLEGKLTKSEAGDDIAFYMDVVAGTSETSHFLGVQYLHLLEMTSFEEAALISDTLYEDGVTNQVMNLQGWFNRGYYHDIASHIRGVGHFGGKSELAKLNELMSTRGKLYADTSLQKVPFSSRNFNYNAEDSRYYSGYCVGFGFVNPTTLRNTADLGYLERRYNLVSPKFLPRYAEKFAKKITGYDVDGISLRDLGDELHSDKRRTNVINREEALDIVGGQFETLENTGKNLMTSNANAYAFEYSTDIINAPLYANTYRIVDESIPLYAMILHGYVSYSSEVLNNEDYSDTTDTVLTLIENGASPHYRFTYNEASFMKDTATNQFYNTTFSVWEKEAVSMYEKVNEALCYVNNATMVGHEIMENGLRKVTYDNGVTIYVNYTDEEISDNSVTVLPRSYTVEGK